MSAMGTRFLTDLPNQAQEGISMAECKRCYRSTVTCDVCKGDGRVQFMFGDCTECDGTGQVCPDDGKYWQG